MKHLRKRTIIAIAAVSLFTAACTKKKAATAAPPVPAPAAAVTTAKPAPTISAIGSARVGATRKNSATGPINCFRT